MIIVVFEVTLKAAESQRYFDLAAELRPELEPGLSDIEGFSHLFVLWVFDRAEGYDLTARVPLDEETPHGVFASRSPRRPNPIGLTVVELLGRDGPSLRVRGIDMLDGTPILDVKPYLSSVPPDFSTSSVSGVCTEFRKATTCSADRVSEREVKPRMSEKRTVMSRISPPSASLEGSAASASTTAGET